MGRQIVLLFLCVFLCGNIQAQSPGWVVRPSAFQYSMTITAELKVNGAISDDERDEIGVFVSDELRGVASPANIGGGEGVYLVFLNVYSNNASGESLSFEIYDASTGDVVSALNTIIYRSDLVLGSVSSPYLIADNYGPTQISLSSQQVNENQPVGTEVGIISGADAGSALTFSLVGGEGDSDNGNFSVSGNVLSLSLSLDFETQAMHKIRLRAEDDRGEYIERSFVIMVLDVNDAPVRVLLSQRSFPESSTLGSLIGVLGSDDEDLNASRYVYSFVLGSGDDDNGSFLLDGGRLLLNTSADFETKSSYFIRLRSTDADNPLLYAESRFEILVQDVNEAPISLQPSALSVAENLTQGSEIVRFSVLDPDIDDTHTLRLINESATFAIGGGQSLVLGSNIDYEDRSFYFLDIEVTDRGGLSVVTRVALMVENEDESLFALAFFPLEVYEDALPGTIAGHFSVKGAIVSGGYRYDLVSGTGSEQNGLFSISDDRLVLQGMLDYEQSPGLNIRVRASELLGDGVIENSFHVLLLDRNEAPTSLSLSSSVVSEGDALGTTIGNFIIEDEDVSDTHRFFFEAGSGDENNALFVIEDNALRLSGPLGYGAHSALSIRVRASDAVENTINGTFIITVNDASEEVEGISITEYQINENNLVDTEVGTLSVSSSAGFTPSGYALLSSEDASHFFIVGDALFARTQFNYEEKIFYNITIRASDGLNTLDSDMVIVVEDAQEPPTGISFVSLQAVENVLIGTTLGKLRAEDEDRNDTYTYSFVGGEGDSDNGFFSITDHQVVLSSGALDFETKAVYFIRVRVLDGNTNAYEQSLEIPIIDINEAPVSITFTPVDLSENQPQGSLIGRLSTLDEDADDRFFYTFIRGEGDDDNDAFFILEDGLYSTRVFDYEVSRTMSLRIQTKDSRGLVHDESLILPIADANDPHTDIFLSNQSITEGVMKGTLIGELSVEDIDDTPITYEIFSESLTGSFRIEGNSLISAKVFDFESQRVLQVRIEALDLDGNSYIRSFRVNVIDANDLPIGIRMSNNVMAENLPIGTEVGTIELIDEDGNTGAYVFSLSSGEGDTDNHRFNVMGSVLLNGVH